MKERSLLLFQVFLEWIVCSKNNSNNNNNNANRSKRTDLIYKERVRSSHLSSLHNHVLQDLIDPLFCLGVQLVKVLTIQLVLLRRKQRSQQAEAAAQREQHALSLRQHASTQ